MQRRKALALISAAATGAILLPGCDFTRVPIFDNFELDKKTYKIISQLSSKVLPIPEEMILENMSPTEFMFTMMDDCREAEDITKFKSGMQTFLAGLDPDKKFEDTDIGEFAEMFGSVDATTGKETNEAFFLKNVKDYNVQYYKSLNEYLSTYTDWKFVPGEFQGCVKV